MPSSTTTPSPLRVAVPYLLVVALALAAHARSLGAAFVYDDRSIVENDERLGQPSRWGELLTSSYWGDFSSDRLYRPVTTLSFALGRMAFGAGPAGAHAVNWALHAAVAAMLLASARRLFPGQPGATLAASLAFACHPALSEAVAGVVGRADLLAALFSLAAVGAVWRGGSAVLGAGAAALAFLSKESAIGLAVILPLAAGFRAGRRDAFDRRAAIRTALATSLFLAAALALRFAVLATETAPPRLAGFAVENPLAHAPAPERVLTALHVLGRYAGVLALPIRLRSDGSYDQIPLIATPLDAGVVAGAALLAGLAVAGALSLAHPRGRGAVAVAACLALAPLMIVSNILFPIGTIYGERLLYLPALGLALLATAAAPPRLARGAIPALVALLVAFTARTVRREAIFSSEESFFAAMIADSPRSSKAWNTLAVNRIEARRFDEAGRALAHALAIFPDFPEALAQRGKVALALGDPRAAEADFRAAIRRQPAYGLARLELAQILKDGDPPRLDEAATEFETAARLLPRLPEPLYGLGAVRLRQGRDEEALAAFDEALRRRPGFGYARYGRGLVACERGDWAAAEPDFRAARSTSAELGKIIENWVAKAAEREPGAARLLEALRRK